MGGFEQQLQQWVQYDNQLKSMAREMKALREKRDELEAQLTDYAKRNNYVNRLIQWKQERFKIVETKVTEPLTFRYLEKSLGEIIADDTKVRQIVEHVRTHRASKLVSEIKRFNEK